MRWFAIAVLALSSAVYAATGDQEGVRAVLFEAANEALKAANAARASVFAPKSYGAAAEHYRRAEALLEQGKGIERIREELAEAVVDLNNAVASTAIVEAALLGAVQARADADSADAKRYAADLWQDAEVAFAQGATRVEEGSLKAGQRFAKTAETKYREAELEAIKVNYLSETENLLARAEKLKAKRYAPKTLANAKALFAEAEKQLNENRYDTDQPRSIALNAKHEASLAIYLSETLAQVRGKDLTMEDLILDWQTPLKGIGAAIDLPVYFDDGYTTATSEIIARLEDVQKTSREYSQDLAERKVLTGDLQRQIAELESQLGGASQERLALNQQLEQQAAIRAKFRKVEQMFESDEAIVLRSGNDVILRLVGLTFDSGQAEIKPERFALLSKVKAAITTFENSELVVEGHTDSFGGDDLNLALSERRAEATRSYLLANMALDSLTVSAVGYGESRPVANNETPEGRAKNRRIDIVIQPTFF